MFFVFISEFYSHFCKFIVFTARFKDFDNSYPKKFLNRCQQWLAVLRLFLSLENKKKLVQSGMKEDSLYKALFLWEARVMPWFDEKIRSTYVSKLKHINSGIWEYENWGCSNVSALQFIQGGIHKWRRLNRRGGHPKVDFTIDSLTIYRFY